MQGFRKNLIETGINSGKDILSSITSNFIKDQNLRGMTDQIIGDTAQSLNDLHRNRIKDQGISESKPPAENGINQKPKQNFWSRTKNFFSNLWGKIKKPAQGLIGKIPYIGGAANALIDAFDKTGSKSKGKGIKQQ